MNVLLISCPKLEWMQDSKGSIPVPLLSIAAVLRQKGFSPHLLDLSILESGTKETSYDDLTKRVVQVASAVDPAIVGFNCFVSQHLPFIIHASEQLKTILPNIHITIGGAHPSIFFREILSNCLVIDSVIVGEGRRTNSCAGRLRQQREG